MAVQMAITSGMGVGTVRVFQKNQHNYCMIGTKMLKMVEKSVKNILKLSTSSKNDANLMQ